MTKQIGRKEVMEDGEETMTHNLKIEQHSYIIGKISNEFSSFIRIGKYTSIARGLNVLVGPQAQHPATVWPDLVSNFPFLDNYPQVRDERFGTLTIGHDVWIGQNVTIVSKGNIEIGHGSIIGVGSVVTKDVEPYSVVAGNPAILVKKRFQNHIILDLLALAWWDFDDTIIRSFMNLYPRMEEFCKAVREYKTQHNLWSK